MNATTNASGDTYLTAAGGWTLDVGHSAVGFTVRHMMITNVRGEFERYRGDVTFGAGRLEATKINATIDVASLNTREEKRDADLRSSIFFDADSHPQMTFVSKSVRAAGDGNLDVVGDLMIRGVTREVTLAVRDISGVQIDMRGNPRIGATASTTIKRSDFGMTWNKVLETGGIVVSDLVTVTVEISLVKAQ